VAGFYEFGNELSGCIINGYFLDLAEKLLASRASLSSMVRPLVGCVISMYVGWLVGWLVEYQAVWSMTGCALVSSSVVDDRMCLSIKQCGR